MQNAPRAHFSRVRSDYDAVCERVSIASVLGRLHGKTRLPMEKRRASKVDRAFVRARRGERAAPLSAGHSREALSGIN